MKKIISLSAFILLFVSCTGDSGPAIEDAFKVDNKVSGSTQNGLCYVDQYAPDEAAITRDIDIVIVADSSVSLKEERSDIAKGFDHFLKTLPSEVNYHVGVILAHSGKSPKSGVLFQRDEEPLVLDSRQLSIEDILYGLNEKLKSPAGDGFGDGGEMGLYSLHTALKNNLASLRSEGIFRPEAALAVVFLSDEQDICFDYPEHITPVEDKQKKEVKAKAKYCDGINADSVLAAIKEANGDKPLVVGGIIYDNPQTVPNEGENEIGYGYKELIEKAGGITIDLASGDYGNGLERLGVLAQSSVKPENNFNLKASPIDQDSIAVTVDGSNVDYNYASDLNQVQLAQERSPFSVARLEYCQKKESPIIASQVVAGGFHTCSVFIDGKVKCWGQNNFGQLGYGHTDILGDDEQVESIDYLAIDEKVIDLSAGLFHNCAVLKSGKVLCWGGNDKGQLGLGHTDNIGDDEDLSNAVKIDLGEKAIRIYSGTRYNCALLESKNVKCWGENSSGQLGYGNTDHIGDNENLSNLSYVDIGSTVIQMDISTISNHTCAALSSGDLKCWGNNAFGQLGYGHTDNLGDDELVSDVPAISFGNKVLQLATGFVHTCALEEGQKVRCWGKNNLGQIGLGFDDTIGDDEAANSAAQIDLSGNGNDAFKMVATGNNHTCVIGQESNIHCWGLGALGALGTGSSENIGDDESINNANTAVNIASEFSQISGGVNHTCALEKHEGKVICWGQNSFGQLGIGHKDNIGDDELPSQFVLLK